MRRWLIGLCVLCLPLTAMAVQHLVQVQHAWTRPAMAGQTGLVYLTITDHGGPDQLIGVSSPAAEKAELYQMTSAHGVTAMRVLRSLPVLSGKTLALKPGVLGVRLIHLKHALTAGDRVPLTLTFARSGKIAAMAMVERSAAQEIRHEGGVKAR